MASSLNNASAQANDNGVGTIAWALGSGDVYSSNDDYATATLSAGETSQYLAATGFNFAIPSGATIVGIIATFERKANIDGVGYPVIKDFAVNIIKAGLIAGSSKADLATAWTTTDTQIAYGDATALWDNSWSASDINSSTFGVAIAAVATGGINPAVAQVDHVTIEVFYVDVVAEQQYVQVQTLPFDAWSEELELSGDSFVGHQPTDGAIVVDTSATEQGYTPTEIPGEWGEDGRGDWYATLPQGVEVVVSSAVDSVPAFFAPLPEWEEVGVDTYALTLDPQTIEGATCECTGTIAFDADDVGTIAFDGVVVIEFEETEETGPYGTISAVDGCGTIAFDDSCEC